MDELKLAQQYNSMMLSIKNKFVLRLPCSVPCGIGILDPSGRVKGPLDGVVQNLL